jgi:hypothetical protein
VRAPTGADARDVRWWGDARAGGRVLTGHLDGLRRNGPEILGGLEQGLTDAAPDAPAAARPEPRGGKA